MRNLNYNNITRGLISVIIPVYNTEKYIEDCLKSVITQTYHNIEVLVVDDGSSDGSLKVCRRIALSDNRVKVFTKKNEGVSTARNLGLSKARGSYISFIDSDDSCNSNMLQILHSLLEESDASISVCKVFNHTDGAQYPQFNTLNTKVYLPQKTALMSLLYQDRYSVGVYGKLYKKELFNGVLFDESLSYSEDLEINYRLINKSIALIYTHSPLYFYYQREGSAMNSTFSIERMDGLSAVSKIYEDANVNYPVLLPAAVYKYFYEALTLLVQMSGTLKKYQKEKDKCIGVVKKLSHNVLSNSQAKFHVRIYALISLISIRSTINIIKLPNKFKRNIK